MPLNPSAVVGCLLALAAAAAVASDAATRPVLIAGDVVAVQAQPIVVPPSNNSPVVLRTFVADGTDVRRGDVVLRIDPGQTTILVSALRTQIDQARARHARTLADLEVAALDAREALLVAEADLARARIDAAIPPDYLSALDRDRYAGALEKAGREVEVRRRQLAAADAAIDTQRRDAALEIDRLTLELGYNEAQVRLSEVRAAQDGVVVQGFSPWSGRRISEGESVQTGTVAGELIGAGGLAVRAWALEADRQRLAVGMPVRLRFDALPAREVRSTIESIAGAPEARAAWGAGRYFRVGVPLPEEATADLAPGMSVLLLTEPEDAGAPVAVPSSPARLELDGELVSRDVAAIAPPAIAEVFQFTIARLVPEGASVRAGEPVAVFEAPGLVDRLPERRNQREEKRTQLRQMQLAHAEAEKADALAAAEAESLAEKAARKATQPEELVRRVDYQKLVVDRELAATRARIARERESARVGRARPSGPRSRPRSSNSTARSPRSNPGLRRSRCPRRATASSSIAAPGSARSSRSAIRSSWGCRLPRSQIPRACRCARSCPRRRPCWSWPVIRPPWPSPAAAASTPRGWSRWVGCSAPGPGPSRSSCATCGSSSTGCRRA